MFRNFVNNADFKGMPMKVINLNDPNVNTTDLT